MTDKEMAEEYAKGLCKTCTLDTCRNNTLHTCAIKEYIKQAHLAGLKAGRPKWHKVADRDLPKEEDLEMQVLCFTTNGYQLLSLFSDPKPIFEYYEVIDWCEIPKYKEK